MTGFHSLKIKDIVRETHKAVSISFEIPEVLKKDFTFVPGQYLSLKKLINGEIVRRSYSISSTPSSNFLSVTVKELENGVFSTYANRNLEIGDTLDVAFPEGRFVLDQKKKETNSIVAFAAGSGITPIMSIIKTALTESDKLICTLVYGNKSPEETIFYKDLKSLSKVYDNRLQIEFVFSQKKTSNSILGRIDHNNTKKILKKINSNYNENTSYFVCGPTGMINTVKNVLLSSGVPKDRILYELFSEDVNITQNDINQSAHNHSVDVTIVFEDEPKTIRVNSNKTILDAALEHDIDVPYSCKGGVCSSCICRVIKGSAEMKKNIILSENEVHEGLILSCQAVPTSEKIIIDFDDV